MCIAAHQVHCTSGTTDYKLTERNRFTSVESIERLKNSPLKGGARILDAGAQTEHAL